MSAIIVKKYSFFLPHHHAVLSLDHTKILSFFSFYYIFAALPCHNIFVPHPLWHLFQLECYIVMVVVEVGERPAAAERIYRTDEILIRLIA